jgi:hypothetical protein
VERSRCGCGRLQVAVECLRPAVLTRRGDSQWGYANFEISHQAQAALTVRVGSNVYVHAWSESVTISLRFKIKLGRSERIKMQRRKLAAGPIVAIAALAIGLAGCSSTDDSASSASPTQSQTQSQSQSQAPISPSPSESLISPTSQGGPECTKEAVAAGAGTTAANVVEFKCGSNFAAVVYNEGEGEGKITTTAALAGESDEWVKINKSECEVVGNGMPDDVRALCQTN